MCHASLPGVEAQFSGEGIEVLTGLTRNGGTEARRVLEQQAQQVARLWPVVFRVHRPVPVVLEK